MNHVFDTPDNTHVRLFFSRYVQSPHAPAIQLHVIDENGVVVEPYMTCTINPWSVGQRDLAPNEVVLKTYSENEECAMLLIAHGVIEDNPERIINITPWQKAPIYRLTPEAFSEIPPVPNDA